MNTGKSSPQYSPTQHSDKQTTNSGFDDKLAMQQRLIFALQKAESVLHTNKHFYTKISEALGIIGEAAGVDRAYIFENLRDPQTGDRVVSQRFEWSKNVYETQIDNPDLQYASYEALGMQRWYQLLSEDGTINGPISELPQSERDFLQQQGIASLIVVPVFKDDRFWGFAGFDDCHRTRKWQPFEEAALRIGAGCFVDCIEAQRQANTLQLEKTRLSTTLHMVTDGVVATDDAGRITLMNRAAEKTTGYSAQEAVGQILHAIFKLSELKNDRAKNIAIVEIIRQKRVPRTTSVYHLHRKDGHKIPVCYTLSLLHGADNTVIGSMLVFRETAQHQKPA